MAKVASIALAATALVGMVAVATLALSLPPTVHADHNSTQVVCPDPIPEGNTGKMGIRRSGYKIKRAYFFTYYLYHTADPSDYEEHHGTKVESDKSGGDRTLWGPIVTKEDLLPEHDETFEMGFWAGGAWHPCVVTIEDDDAPEIIRVEISSRPVDRHAYRAGESIDVTVHLDQKVEVDGTPLLSLFIGDGADSTWRGAPYHSGSGTRSLVFRYRVQPEDFDSDGISVTSAAVDDDGNPAGGFGGNIYAKGTDVPIDYAHPGLRGDWRQKVDGRPYVQSSRIISSPPDGWQAYRANQAIEVSMTFDTDVAVEGEVTLDLYLGLEDYKWHEAIRKANYIRGSGSDTLVFGYTVRPGDMDPKGVGLIMGTENEGFGGSGAIAGKDSGVLRNPWYLGSGHQPKHKVDTEPPAISTVNIGSRPAGGDAYETGEEMRVEVVFSEKVKPHGDLQVELDVGGVARFATLRSVPGDAFSDSLVFAYTVQQGDEDADGVGIGANSLRLNGGGIYDGAGNSSGLSHGAVAAGSDQKVATSE